MTDTQTSFVDIRPQDDDIDVSTFPLEEAPTEGGR
jgi:hypothetical protein